MLYNAVLISAVQQSESAIYMYTYPLFLEFPSHLGHHRALNRVPWAIQVLISFHFIYSITSVYVSIIHPQFLRLLPSSLMWNLEKWYK